MMPTLWSDNAPAAFWSVQRNIPDAAWQDAIREAAPVLGLPALPQDQEAVLAQVLGEAQFGAGHWKLTPVKRLYYAVKPLVPQAFRNWLHELHRERVGGTFPLGWPIEDRYVLFQLEVLRRLLLTTGAEDLPFIHFWPGGHRFASVLTHDVETAAGQANVRAVADLEEGLGFRSSFNFVPERYPLDAALIDELRDRGFEIGVHGLYHDGKLFSSHREFMRRAERINGHLHALQAVGFRSPLMLRNPEWLQALDIEYDLSFFDTDPCQPMPGGVMTIWPFTLGRFIELPYTLMQDCTVTRLLGETTPRLWLQKVDFIARNMGMALVNTHPDYLFKPATGRVYADFLRTMASRADCWHAQPREVARWWRVRPSSPPGASVARALLANGGHNAPQITCELSAE